MAGSSNHVQLWLVGEHGEADLGKLRPPLPGRVSAGRAGTARARARSGTRRSSPGRRSLGRERRREAGGMRSGECLMRKPRAEEGAPC